MQTVDNILICVALGASDNHSPFNVVAQFAVFLFIYQFGSNDVEMNDEPP